MTGDRKHRINNNVEIIIDFNATWGNARDNSRVNLLSRGNTVLISFRVHFLIYLNFIRNKARK